MNINQDNNKKGIDDDEAGKDRSLYQLIKPVAINIAGFATLHSASKYLFSRFLLQHPKYAASLSARDINYLIPSLACSTVQSLVIGCSGAYLSRILDPWKRDVVNPYPKELDHLLPFCIGFGLWDSFLMFMNGESPVMWAHHIVMTYGCILLWKIRKGTFAPVNFFQTELTLFPQNILLLMKKLKIGKYKKMMLVLRALFHLLFRTFIGPTTLFRIHKTMTLSKFMQIDPFVIPLASMINISILGTLNIMWGAKVLRKLKHLK